MGSPRLISRQMAEAALAEAEKVRRGVAAARTALSRRQDPADPLSLVYVKPGKALFGKVLLFCRLKLGDSIKRTDMKMRFRRPWESFAKSKLTRIRRKIRAGFSGVWNRTWLFRP